ncbi:MAG TPA: hydroxyacid dehydrogenase [Rugosimonospora sp.]|nr:hydroxyacid dehydrogenase [Rugosimonospora sp.]
MTRRVRPTAVLAMRPDLPAQLFTPHLWERLHAAVDIDPGLVLDDLKQTTLSSVDILVTGWGCPPVTAGVLDAAPRLAALIHTGGSVKPVVTGACWARGIAVSTAAAANAIPVAEYTLAAILLAGKAVRAMESEYRARRAPVDPVTRYPHVGNYRRSVGVVGASRIGRRVLELLRPFDFDVALCDPYLGGAEARALGARLVPLPDLLGGCDIVTLHAPSLPGTRHLVDRAGLARMRDGATLINTARGALVDQEALLAELIVGRLDAVLDVTEPEVLPPDSPLYHLPNVTLTPHVAGAVGTELRRLGASAVDEVARYVAGQPFAHPVYAADLARIA